MRLRVIFLIVISFLLLASLFFMQEAQAQSITSEDVAKLMGQPSAPDSSISKEVQALTSSNIARPKTVEYSAGTFKDPFIEGIIEVSNNPLQVTEDKKIYDAAIEQSLSSLKIQGIIWGGRFPQAIINGAVLGVGQTVAGARLVDITKEGILVLYNNKTYIITSPAAMEQKKYLKKDEGGENE